MGLFGPIGAGVQALGGGIADLFGGGSPMGGSTYGGGTTPGPMMNPNAGGGGFNWGNVGDALFGSNAPGAPPEPGLLGRLGQMDALNLQQPMPQNIGQQNPGGAPNMGPGVFGLEQLIAQMGRGA